MDSFELYGASYCRFRNIDVEADVTSKSLAVGVSAYLNNNIKGFESNIPEHDVIPHILVSTSVSKEFNGTEKSWPNAQACFSRNMKYPPTVFVNAYECASWGYALRFVNQFNSKGGYVLLSVLDLNLDGLSFWEASEHWGESGFGLATILLKIGSEDALKVAETISVNPMADFCMNIRRKIKADSRDLLSMPFFPKDVRALNDRILKNIHRLDDLHDKVGHCFGSDPWISLIKNSESILGKKVLMSSLAYSGYWSLLSLDVSLDAKLSYCESSFKIETSKIDRPCDTESANSDLFKPVSFKDTTSIKYELIGTPMEGVLIKSHQLVIPLMTDVDYRYFSSIYSNQSCFFTPNIKYKNLHDLLNMLSIESSYIILRIPAPATIPMPDRFLSKDVFCCADSDYFMSNEVAGYCKDHENLVSISDRSFIPYIDPNGDNTLSISGRSLDLESINSYLTSKNYNRAV